MEKQPKAICVIPARMQSSRFPGKPLCLIGGKLMIQRVYESVAKSGYPTYIATDHEDIKEAVLKFGGQCVMTSENHSTGTERVKEAVDILFANDSVQAEIVINIQGDEPFIHSDQIKNLVEEFDIELHQILTLAKPFDPAPDKLIDDNKCCLVKDINNKVLYFSRLLVPYCRPGKTITKFLHLGIYAYRADVLKKYVELPASQIEQCESLEQNRWLENGGSIHVIETSYENLSVDTQKDLEEIEQLISDKKININD